MTNRLEPLDPARTHIDNDYYEGVGDAWWDVNGPLSALHEMNPVRVGYFDRALAGQLGDRPRGEVRVLDVGCGGGLVSEALARQGYRVRGVDLAPGAVAAARRHAAASGVAVEYEVGSAYSLPCDDAAVDAVVVSDVLEHLHDLNTGVAELARVLRPGGVLAFDTINRTPQSYVIMILFAERVLRVAQPGTHNWSMFIRPTELSDLFGRHGLRMVEQTGLAPARPVPMAIVSYLRTHRLGGYRLSRDMSASYIGHAVKTADSMVT